MRLLLFFSCLSLSLCAFGQNSPEKDIDSLERQLKAAKADTAKVDILCLLTRAYGGVDSLKTFQMGAEALRLSTKIDYLKGAADAYIALGGSYMDYSLLEKARGSFEKGNVLAEKLIAKDSSKQNLNLWAKGHYNLGLTYGYGGDNGKEIELTQKVIPVVTALGDSLFLANIHTNLGVKYLNLAQYKDAYKSLALGGAIYKKMKDPRESTFNKIKMAGALFFLDSLPQMKKVLEDAKFGLAKYPNDFDRFNYYLEESNYYREEKSYKKAIASLNEALNSVNGDKTSVQYSLLAQRYALLYQLMQNYGMARKYMTEYFENAKARKDALGMFQAYYKRSQFEAAGKNYKKAHADLLLAIDMYDSLETAEITGRVRELELKYGTAQKEREILALKNEKNKAALALEKNRSQAYLMAITIGAMVFILSMGYFFYRSKLRKAQKKERIQEAQVNLLKQEQQNKIFSAMIEGQEKERKRLAIDLHDGLGGRLSGISLKLSKLDKDEPKKYPKKQLLNVMKDLDDSLTELRSIARNMMPETLVKFGLEAALKDYCSSMTGSGTKVTLQFYGSDKGIGPNQQVTIYRVIQELINNAIKHAKATEVLVQYMREGNHVDITVEDNGVGLDSGVLESESTGMGLSNLRTRVAYLKGNLDFYTEKNEGTTVNVHITIDAA